VSAGALGTPLHVLAETTSTNDLAKRAAKAGAPHGAVWMAEAQTSGRGRQGRAWVSPAGENLLFSVLLRVTCAPSRLPPLALVAGLAARDAAANALGGAAEPKLKWPNDVVVGAKKLAGVLVESIVSGGRVEAVVVGIGMNVLTRAFPDDIAARATSLALLGAASLDRMALLADVLAGLERDVETVAARGLGPLHARLAAADALAGTRVRGELGEGTAAGIDPDGRLLVRGADGVLRHWSAGEVHLVAATPAPDT
jgi:BirA family transcriptional regulator, biotin operon repressor / biotin---[acetyl-CoA-carboxylase] ligase